MVLNKTISEEGIVAIYGSIRVLNIFALHIVQFQPLAFSRWLLGLRIIHSGKRICN